MSSCRPLAGALTIALAVLALSLPRGAQAQLPQADLSITKSDSPDPVFAGADLTYTIVVTNGGPDAVDYLASPSWNDALLPGSTFVSLTQTTSTATWACSTPAVGDGGSVFCTLDSSVAGNTFPVGSDTFTLVVHVDPSTPSGSIVTNTADVSVFQEEGQIDPDPTDNSASQTTTVLWNASLAASKTVAGSLVPGGAVTYTLELTNSGASTQADNSGDELVDVLPAELVLVSASATSGTAIATVATNTVTWNGSLPAGGSVTITIQATIGANVAPFTLVSNQATLMFDISGDGVNETPGLSDDPTVGGGTDPTTFTVQQVSVLEIPALGAFGLAALSVLLAVAGLAVLRKRLGESLP